MFDTINNVQKNSAKLLINKIVQKLFCLYVARKFVNNYSLLVKTSTKKFGTNTFVQNIKGLQHIKLLTSE